MYVPRLFEGTPEMTRELLHAHPFATVIGVQPDGELEVTHVPLLVDEGSSLRLTGHVARANPFARLITAGAKVTATFHGPDGYVSASVYESPTEEVPTWNYAVVHVRGTLRPLDDVALTEQLEAMAKRFERGAAPWHAGLLAPDFFADLRRGIVGFAIEATEVRTKLKLSQNRSSEDRRRAEAAFAASDVHREREVAAWMRRVSTEAAET